jgi:hypothetical protein
MKVRPGAAPATEVQPPERRTPSAPVLEPARSPSQWTPVSGPPSKSAQSKVAGPVKRAAPAPVAARPLGSAALEAANELHRALMGGLTGFNVDEGQVWAVMSPRSAEELVSIQQAYSIAFGRDLRSDLKVKLRQGQSEVIEQLFAGKTDHATALALRCSRQASVTPFDSWPQPIEILRPLSDAARLNVARDYLKLEGTAAERAESDPGPAFLRRLVGSLSQADLLVASDWMVKAAANGGVFAGKLTKAQQVELSAAKAAKKELSEMLEGDPPAKLVLNTLAGLDRSTRPWILGDRGLVEKLGKALPGLGLERARALLQNDEAGAKAVEIRSTLLGNAAAPVLGVFANAIGPGVDAGLINDAFAKQTGSALSAQKMSPPEQRLLTKVLSGTALVGEDSLELDGLKLVAAIATADFANARGALEGKAKSQVDRLTRLAEPALRAYEQKAGTGKLNLRQHLERAFSGSEEFELLQKLDHGQPQSDREELIALAQRALFEQSVALDGVQTFLHGESGGARLARQIDAANHALGKNDSQVLLKVVGASAQGYVANKNQAAEEANVLGSYATTGAALLAAPLTGGSSLGLMALGPAIGAGAKIAIKGPAMKTSEVRAAVVGAGVGVLANAIPMGAAGSVMAKIAKAGLISGGSEGATAAAEVETWEDGLHTGAARVLKKAGEGALSGAAYAAGFELAGLGVQGAISKISSAAAARKIDPAGVRTMIDAAPLADGHAHDLGTFPKDQVLSCFREAGVTSEQRLKQILGLKELNESLSRSADASFQPLHDPAAFGRDGANRIKAMDPVLVASKSRPEALLNQLIATKERLSEIEPGSLETRILTEKADSLTRDIQALMEMQKPGDAQFGDGINPAVEFFTRYNQLLREPIGTLGGAEVFKVAHTRSSAPSLGYQELRSELIPWEGTPDQAPEIAAHFARDFNKARARAAKHEVRVTAVFTKSDVSSPATSEFDSGFRTAERAGRLVDAWFGNQKNAEWKLVDSDTRAVNASHLQRAINGLDSAGRESSGRTPTTLWFANAKRSLYNAEGLQAATREARRFELHNPSVGKSLTFQRLFEREFDKAGSTLKGKMTAAHALELFDRSEFGALEQGRVEQVFLGQRDRPSATGHSAGGEAVDLLPPNLKLATFTPEELATMNRMIGGALRSHRAVNGTGLELPPQFGSTIHAGEQIGSVDSFVLLHQVDQSLRMGADRIGHGVILGVPAEDLIARGKLAPARKQEFERLQQQLVDRVKANGTIIEVNMSSNTAILNQTDAQHPIGNFERSGMRYSINTDDETILATDVRREMQRVAHSAALSRSATARAILEGYDTRLGATPLRNAPELEANLFHAITRGATSGELTQMSRDLAAHFNVPVTGKPAEVLRRVISRVVR